MRNSSLIVLLCVSFVASVSMSEAQSAAKPVSLLQLIATPERFDGSSVALTGYLVMGPRSGFFGQQSALYLHEDDARNLLLANSVWISPSEQMERDREKIDHIYVNIKGTFHAARGGGRNAYEGGSVMQIESCTPWSNPNHPIGLKNNEGKYK